MSSRNFTWFFLFSALGLLAFGAGLSNPMVFDDLSFIQGNAWLRVDFIKGFFNSFLPISTYGFSGYRPVVLTSFVLDRWLMGESVAWMRAHNLFFHVANTFMVFLLSRRFWRRHFRETGVIWPLLAALVFLLHPLQTNVITLVWKRSDLYALFGVLLACLSFGLSSENGRFRGFHFTLGWFGFFFALLSKESVAVFPGLLFLTQRWIFEPRRKASLLFWSSIMLVAFAHITLILFVQPSKLAGLHFQSYMPESMQLGRWDYLKTQISAGWLYLRLLLMPNHLQVLHWVEPVRSTLNPGFLSGLVAVMAAIGLAGSQWRQRPWILFLMGWSFLALLPTSTVIPLQMIVDEDRMYVPMVAFGLGVSVFFRALDRLFAHTRSMFRLLAAVLLVVYAGLDIQRAFVWKNPLALWTQNALASPKDPRPWINIANEYVHRGRMDRADACFQTAIELDPSYSAAHYFYAEFLLTQGNLSAARLHFVFAKDRGYLVSDSLMNLAVIAHREGQIDSAQRLFGESLRENPENTLALRNYAEFLFEAKHDYPGAMGVLERAYQMAPWETDTKLKIASITARQGGHDDDVRAILDEILKANPDHAEAKRLRDGLTRSFH